MFLNGALQKRILNAIFKISIGWDRFKETISEAISLLFVATQCGTECSKVGSNDGNARTC